jgi:Protein of unknown function (DUF3187)
MERSYEPGRGCQGLLRIIFVPVARAAASISCLFLLLALAAPAAAQVPGLPSYAPINPVASSRTSLYFQPFRELAGSKLTSSISLDYASLIEYNNDLPTAKYVLDSEVLRLTGEISRTLTPRSFLAMSISTGGAYAGFLDGFLHWYHSTLGIRISEREKRPNDSFLYTISLPNGRSVTRPSSDFYLGDFRATLGLQLGQRVQTALTITLPTSTAPEGYRRGVPSIGILNTFRARQAKLTYEGSLNLGFTPNHGALADFQKELFLAASSGIRFRFWGRQSLYGNLFYHSPYYGGTTLPALDRRELSLDFGWVLQTRRRGEWRLGLTEDLEPGGPGVDLVFRLGHSF